ncbi:MAG: hypothetical protein ACTHNU_02335 [Gaiellales bacterium]
MKRALRGGRWAAVAGPLALLVSATAATPAGAALANRGSHPVFALVRPVGVRQAAAAPAGNLTYHGGKIIKTSTTYAIFWLPPKLQNGHATGVSATYRSLITRYFHDIGGSGLMNSATQYYQTAGGVKTAIVNKSTFAASWTDAAAYPASGCSDSATPGNCLTDTQARAEISRAIKTNNWTPGATTVFFLFTSRGEGSCVGSDCAFQVYCAYHSHYTLNGKIVYYGNMPYAGTDLAHCGDTASPNNDIDADSTINLTSHEQMEAITDPAGTAWYDSQRQENGDKCAWTFGSQSLDGGKANQSWHGHFYLVQQEWSNKGSNCVQKYP